MEPLKLRCGACQKLVDKVSSSKIKGQPGICDFCKTLARPYPKQFLMFYEIAKEHGLSYPNGRALYMCNRVANGDGHERYSEWMHSIHGEKYNREACNKAVADRMKRIHDDTAYRWVCHWQNGGNIKQIGISGTEYAAKRREYDRKWRT